MKNLTYRAVALLFGAVVTTAACAADQANLGGNSRTDASADSGACDPFYCPGDTQRGGIGCCLPSGACGADYGAGCVTQGTNYGP